MGNNPVASIITVAIASVALRLTLWIALGYVVVSLVGPALGVALP